MDQTLEDQTKYELKQLRAAFRMLGVQWDAEQQQVVLADADTLPNMPQGKLEDVPKLVKRTPQLDGTVIEDTSKLDAYRGKSIFFIKQKVGGKLRFVAKPAQLQLLTEIYQQMARGEPVYIVILKARQIGFSTLIALLFLALSIVKGSVETIVAAHVERSAKKIFSIYKSAYRNIPKEIRPDKEFDNTQELKLKWNESLMSSFVAKEGSMGVSTSTAYSHFSEYALWTEAPGQTLSTALDSMAQVVGTIAVIETTSRGRGNDYYRLWKTAREDQRAALHDSLYVRNQPWEAMFFSWMSDAEYTAACNYDENGVCTEAFTAAELEFQRTHGCTNEQLLWRKKKIAAKATSIGFVAAMSHFNRENPTTEEDAFKAAGDTVFDPTSLDWIRSTFERKDPVVHYWPLLTVGPAGTCHGARAFMQTTPVDNKKGTMRVYVMPQEGREYMICADPSKNEGPNPDRAAFHVIDVHAIEQVAVFQGYVDPDDFGDVIVAAAMFYNSAYIGCESNTAGLGTCLRIAKELLWTKFYTRGGSTTNKSGNESLGFNTNKATRPQLIANGQKYILKRKPIIHDSETFDELEAFRRIFDEKRQVYDEEALPGEHDDLVMALLIGFFIGNFKYRWHRKKSKDVKVVRTLDPYQDGNLLEVELDETPEEMSLAECLSD